MPGHRPHDDPDEAQRDADRLRRLVVVGDGAQARGRSRCFWKKRASAATSEPATAAATRSNWLTRTPPMISGAFGMPISSGWTSPPQTSWPKPSRKNDEADRRHEQDDRLLIDQRPQHQPLDRDGEQHHDRGGDDEGAADRHAALDQPDEGQGGEQHHRALGEIEHARGLEDQHEAQRDERVHDPESSPPMITSKHEFGIVPHVGKRGDEDGGHHFHRRRLISSCRRRPGSTDPHSERLTSGSRLSPG